MPAYKDKNSGKWLSKFNYRDHNGEIKQAYKRGFERKKDAEKWEQEYLQSIEFQPQMTMDAFYAIYMKETGPRIKKHTQQNRHYLYKNRVKPYFGEMRICDITANHIRKWQNDLIKSGFSDTYLATCNTFLNTLFNYAVKFYNLNKNPVKAAGTIGSYKPQNEMKIWTLKQFKTAIAEVKDIQAQTAIILLFWTGIRKGELLALTWADIDLKKKYMKITKSLQRIEGQEIVTAPKTKKSIRKITLPQQAVEALKEYKKKFYNPLPNQRVFPWSKRFIEKGMQECFKTGVPKIRVHDLRHSHASLLIEMGYSPVLIAQRLGHEKITTTLNTYSHLWPNKQEELAEELSEL